jgi:ABC-2 type transport system permease protein
MTYVLDRYLLADSVTMLRRDMRHMLRFPLMTVSGVAFPCLMLLLFTYVFGAAIGGGGLGGYVNYIVPGILMMAIGGGGGATAININEDMSEGVIARLRTMAIPRIAVLAGQVAGSVIRTMLSLVLVIGVALLVGFRPSASPLEWLGVIGLAFLVTFAVSWMCAAFGLVSKTPAGANSSSLLFQFGPFVSSAFVSPDAMSKGIRWFAEYQPFTPIIDTFRNLLTDAPLGTTWIAAVAWSLGLSVVGILWSRAAFLRLPAR